MWRQLEASDLVRLLGNTVQECAELLSEAVYDLRYRHLNREEKDKLIIRILERIDSPDLSLAGPEGKVRWEKGWQENLDNFVASGYNPGELTPKYIHPNQPIRLFGDYVIPHDSHFELSFYILLRRHLFKKYLPDADAIYEFGCGPAHNLVELARMYPDKELHGLEWAGPSLEIIRLLAQKHGYKVIEHEFNMFTPKDLEVNPNTAFLEIGAFEQLGKNFEPMLEFMLNKKPKIVVQMDAFLELCNPDNLSDYLSIKHNTRRNYLRGYLTRLRELEAAGKIQIIKAHKVKCCGLYEDGYSYVVWEPTIK